MNKQLAKVKSASLNITDRGILTFWIFVDYEDGGGQEVGGLCLDEWNEEKQDRIGTAYGCEMIRQLLLFFNVDSFEKMKDRIIFVLGEGEGFGFTPKGIQTLKVDGEQKTLVFKDVHRMFYRGSD